MLDSADQLAHFLPPPRSSTPTTITAKMSGLAKKNSTGEASPFPAQRTGTNDRAGLGLPVTRATIAPGWGSTTPSMGSTISTSQSILAAHLDITPSLQKATHSVVKARNGSVLSRGSILKTDHYPSGECFELLRGEGVQGSLSGCCRCDVIVIFRPRSFLYIKSCWDLPLTVVVLSREGTRS